MKRTFSSLVFLLTAGIIHSQTGIKGVAPVESSSQSSGTTRAVIVGISNYEQIEDLQYADRDAQVFRDYLRSPAGGSIDSANITLLLNEKASIGNMVAAFEWLKAESKPDDKAIIYFSGHGDVETLTDAQNGFLLTYNSPKAVYFAGAFPVYVLKDYLTTLTKKNVQVVFIADACRSGSLAGGSSGVQQTGAVLQQQWANESKILSCQPGELSQEGKQWGSGRGLFSYHFVRGLQGLADMNQNKEVTLSELMVYLTVKVPEDARPLHQNPILNGNMQATLAHVDEATLNSLKETVRDGLSPINTKGILDDLLKGVSEGVRKQYQKFEAYLEQGRTYVRDGEDAWDIYLALLDSSLNMQLIELMQRNLAANMQNEAQAVINVYLEGKELNISFQEEHDYFMDAATKMQKANELMGDSSLWAKSFAARQLFLEARSVIRSKGKGNVQTDKVRLQDAINKLKSSLQLEPQAAYSYQALGMIYALMGDDALAIGALQKASEMTPKWAFPMLTLGNVYYKNDDAQSERSAKQYYLKALELDSTYLTAHINLGSIFFYESDFKAAKEYCSKALALNPAHPNNSVTYRLLGMIAEKEGDSKKAKEYYRKSEELTKKIGK